MATLLISLIKIYQKIPGPWHNYCRHTPTCSNYAIEAITEYGCLKGSYYTCKRLLHCNPFGTIGYDPIPKRNKTVKKASLVAMIMMSLVLFTGCLKTDTMDDITIYTSAYPFEYIVKKLYDKHATITSIYPDGIDIYNYNLTGKQISDYSKGDLFIYNGLSRETTYAVAMINQNKKIKIIDAALGMEYNSALSEIWLNPSNLLMMSQNIKNGFHEYISNPYLKKEIDENYEQLKIAISELDAEIKLTIENAPSKTIVVSNDLFKYFEKYDLQVISLEENENLTARKISDVTNLIINNQIKYIFLTKEETPNTTIDDIIKATGVNTLRFNLLASITEEERNNKEDYISLTKKNIDLLKQELYK